MNRVQQPGELPSVQIQPQAKPVDTFHQPLVRQTDDGLQLGQLANALAEFSPKLNGFMTTVAERQQEASVLRGKADAAKYENLTAFRDAVSAGKLDPTQ